MTDLPNPDLARPVRIAVLGASGYTGADLVRLALGHPRLRIVALAANQSAGQTMADLWPHLKIYPQLPRLVRAEDVPWDDVDAVFGCLPHAASAGILAAIDPRIRIVDLSADFRLDDADLYRDWYGVPHPAPALMADAVYGLSEVARPRLAGARLVACPGCYPTAALLALLPVARAGLIRKSNITINALSGVTGAGRSLKQQNLFAEIAEAAAPYGLGHHRHMPEMEQELAKAFGAAVRISFTPHLLPMNRGELATITVELAPGATAADLRQSLGDAYAAAPFVHVLADGVAPATRMVRGSNHCVLNVFADRIDGRAIIVSAIDNLVKGSSGQAIQNLNLMFGLPETMGLEAAPLFP